MVIPGRRPTMSRTVSTVRLRIPPTRERARTITGSVERHDHRIDEDYYTQPGNLFRLMAKTAQERLIGNIALSMATVPSDIQERQVQHFYKADPDYGRGVAAALGLKDWANYVSA